MAETKFEPVLSYGDLVLTVAFTGNQYFYKLSEKHGGKDLLAIACDPPIEHPHLYVIQKVEFLKSGNIKHFLKMIEMIRIGLRTNNPKADIASFSPNDRMINYYKRLGAARKHETGYIHFPENLAQRQRRKK